MAPPRKSKSAYKRFSNLIDVSPDKDAGSSKSSKQRKKKLSDMLGPQWSKEELERFYESYRKYGKDWRRVAATLRNRSTEMVEALYNMNRAYLSLPEGTASVVGLIAMMTDHYNVLEGSDSDQESNDAVEMRKLQQKRKRGKAQPSSSREDLVHSKAEANDGCLSLLKRRRTDGIHPRAVGKRTPRVPVSYLLKKDGRDNSLPLNKAWKTEVASNDDDVAHGAAIALTVASQRGDSPQVSRSPYRRAEQLKQSPVRSWERMHSHSGATRCGDASLDEEFLEGSIGSRGTENGDFAKDTRSLMDMEGVGTVEVHKEGKKFYRKKEKVEVIEDNEDGGEACSGTEGGGRVNSSRGKTTRMSPMKLEQTRQGQRTKNRKLFFGDEAALDALQTLANLSSMMPASARESESSLQLKEGKPTPHLDDRTGTANRPKDKFVGLKEKNSNAFSGVESKKSKLGRAGTNNSDTLQLKEKRKSKSSIPKLPIAEDHRDSHLSQQLKSEAPAEEVNKSVSKGKRTGQVASVPRQSKSLKSLEISADDDQKGRDNGSGVPTPQIPAASQSTPPIKQRSKRKPDPQRIFNPKEMDGTNWMRNRIDKHLPVQDKASYLKDKISCCLSSRLARRWCTFEWFYSAVDYPWFAKREFVEYLNHVRLGHIPRLTRVEWSVIRSSLGKPRRFSENFLGEERKKLEQYRDSVRKHYHELRTGARDGLPTDLARPLTVGQRVIALHPKTREVHDGSVLTVDHDKCRIQFDRSDIGVEFVTDVDCMPLNPLENMPEALRRQNIFVDKFPLLSKEPQINGQINFGASWAYNTGGHSVNTQNSMNSLTRQDTSQVIFQPKGAAFDASGSQQTLYNQPCSVAHIQAREADIRALSDLTRALDKKEIWLRELRNMNNDIVDDQISGDESLKDSDSFKKHYAMVLVQLKEASGQASSALVNLRERNTYQGNSLPPWPNPQANFSNHPGFSNSLDSGSNILEIMNNSRLKARLMVDTALQAMSCLKEGEDAFKKIGEALDTINNQQLVSDSRFSGITTSDVNSSQPDASNLEAKHSSVARVNSDVDKSESQLPAELITSCVATFLMIQTCTDRHYPPTDVAHIIDSAVTKLRPCCPQNLPIYHEIQMSMGRLKNQILALVPTQI